MNQTFSISRFWKLVRLQWSLNGINFIIGFLLLTFLFSFVLATYQFIEKPSGKFGNGLYYLLYFVFGVAILMTIVPWLKNKKKAGFYLTLPNSIFEKYVFYILIPFVVYVFIFPIWIYFIYLLKILFLTYFLGDSISTKDILSFPKFFGFGVKDGSNPEIGVAMIIIILSSMIPFRIKFFSRAFKYWLIFALSLLFLIPYILSKYRVDFSISESMLLALPTEVYMIIFSSLSLFTGYFLLKEKEV